MSRLAFQEPDNRYSLKMVVGMMHGWMRLRPGLAPGLTTADGIPYQAPETVLFMKAKHTRAKDEADFALTLPTLDTGARNWLAAAIELVHPGHPWLDRCR